VKLARAVQGLPGKRLVYRTYNMAYTGIKGWRRHRGGDFLPYGFRRLGLGKLIGTRTWGGLIGIEANPDLIDGGKLTVPFFRMFTPEGEWRVENEGVDNEVELDPVAVNEERDTQLDAAIANVLEQLKTAKPVALKSAPPVPTQVGK